MIIADLINALKEACPRCNSHEACDGHRDLVERALAVDLILSAAYERLS